jgi:hypothetical protein
MHKVIHRIALTLSTTRSLTPIIIPKRAAQERNDQAHADQDAPGAAHARSSPNMNTKSIAVQYKAAKACMEIPK